MTGGNEPMPCARISAPYSRATLSLMAALGCVPPSSRIPSISSVVLPIRCFFGNSIPHLSIVPGRGPYRDLHRLLSPVYVVERPGHRTQQVAIYPVFCIFVGYFDHDL